MIRIHLSIVLVVAVVGLVSRSIKIKCLFALVELLSLAFISFYWGQVYIVCESVVSSLLIKPFIFGLLLTTESVLFTYICRKNECTDAFDLQQQKRELNHHYRGKSKAGTSLLAK